MYRGDEIKGEMHVFSNSSLGHSCDVFSFLVLVSVVLFQPFLLPIRVSIVTPQTLGMLPYIRTLWTGLRAGRDGGFSLQT